MMAIIEAIIYYKNYCSQKMAKINFFNIGH